MARAAAVTATRISIAQRSSGRCLPVAEWPTLDRMRWKAAFATTDILSANAVTVRWSERSRCKTQKGYGRWLDWNFTRGDLSPDVSPELRATSERVSAYITHLQAVNSPHTVQTRIQELADALRVLAPADDWRWLMAVAWRLRRQARSVRNKTSRMQSPEVLEALGLELMADAESQVRWPLLKQATRFRNGLMISLLARRPLRLKNLAAIAIGRHLVAEESRYILGFPAEEMKNKRPHQVVLPAGLAGRLERYLTYWRGILLTCGGRQSAIPIDALWISREGTPLAEGTIYRQIVKATEVAFGMPVNPHLFRDCSATAVAIAAPDLVHDVPVLLGHTDPSTANRHYNQAGAITAGRRYNRIIDGYRRASRSKQGNSSRRLKAPQRQGKEGG